MKSAFQQIIWSKKMKYRNAQEIFPESLLKQIQRYVSGETIYIPAKNEKKAWGESSGYRKFLQERNEWIRNDFKNGLTIEAISEKLIFPTILLNILFTQRRSTQC